MTDRILTVGKSASARLPCWVQWSDWLRGEAAQLGAAVVITSSEWSSDGLTVLGSPAPELDGSLASVWIEGGTAGERYTLTNTIETDAGHTGIERSIVVVVS